MKVIDERRFSFIPHKKWKTLKDGERKTLGSYKSYYGHLIRTEDKISELEKQIETLKGKKKDYVNKMIHLNHEIDYLRDDYQYSWSVSKMKSKDYYIFTISRRGHVTKTGGLGSPKLIEKHLKEFYKRKKDRLVELEKLGWERFCRKRVMDLNGRIRNMIVDMVSEDSSLKKFSINREMLFPLKTKKGR